MKIISIIIVLFMAFVSVPSRSACDDQSGDSTCPLFRESKTVNIGAPNTFCSCTCSSPTSTPAPYSTNSADCAAVDGTMCSWPSSYWSCSYNQVVSNSIEACDVAMWMVRNTLSGKDCTILCQKTVDGVVKNGTCVKDGGIVTEVHNQTPGVGCEYRARQACKCQI